MEREIKVKSDGVIVIPALNPTDCLVDYVGQLLAVDEIEIIVINDGSRADRKAIFHKLNSLERCTVLNHPVNKGKGRALKTAFSYILDHTDFKRIITADADGQHSVEDVIKVAKELSNRKKGIILGVRDFTLPHVPTKSYLGNQITCKLFQMLFGYWITDTQTGLRGFPRELIGEFLQLKGERYEFEMNMLIYAKKKNIPIAEIPIQTLYFNNNDRSYYHAVVDSAKILRRLISGYLQQWRSINETKDPFTGGEK